MNPIVWIQGLDGVTLAFVICGLLFLEETGVPLPFAPGDLLLAIGGIAISAGKIQPALFVGMAMVAIVGGALVGREIFALLGWERLMKIAGPLHAREPLERASQLLQRNGWRGVFTARLIPGLRVHTTEMAGVSRMPRLPFFAGLTPASAVYVAAFVGLGAAFGRPVLAIIHQAEHQLFLVVVYALIAVALFLFVRYLVRRAEAAFGGWTGVFRFQLRSEGIILIPACIGINFAGHAAAVGLNLPLFGDSMGTILCGLVAGPWVGASVGLISNFVAASTIDPIAAPYAIVSAAVGFVAGLGRYMTTGEDETTGWLALWPACFLVASVLSTPLNLAINGGRTGVALGDALHQYLISAHRSHLLAAFLAEAAIDLPDKLIAVVGALLIYNALPPRPSRETGVELDIATAIASVVRSPHWLVKLVIGGLCLLFSWLVIPFLLFMGYMVAVARRTRDGGSELPDWDRLGTKLKDGALLSLLLLIWYLPSTLMGLPADITETTPAAAALEGFSGADLLASLGATWTVLILVVQPALWAQYVTGGLAAGLAIPAIVRRIKFNLGLTVVVGVVAIVLSVAAFAGLVLLLVGVLLTIPFASYVAAHLYGIYTRLTDRPELAADSAAAGAGRQEC